MNHFILAYIATLGLVSLAGCVGLVRCAPRPGAQEFWGTIAVAPIIILIMTCLVLLS